MGGRGRGGVCTVEPIFIFPSSDCSQAFVALAVSVVIATADSDGFYNTCNISLFHSAIKRIKKKGEVKKNTHYFLRYNGPPERKGVFFSCCVVLVQKLTSVRSSALLPSP